MEITEKDIAKNLYVKLKQHFKDRSESITILIEGKGVYWNCSIELRNRKCIIDCFEYRYYDDVKSEYPISFYESEKEKASGRTYDIEEVIISSEEWIYDKDVEFLHQKYEFIDRHKRRIEYLEKELIICEPELKQTSRHMSSCIPREYNIALKNRLCELHGYGIMDNPLSFMFKWDECGLFLVEQNDLPLMAKAIKKWLIDEIEPSKLNNQFSWIEVGDLAMYYERGEGVKGEFIESWNSTKYFFEYVFKKQIVQTKILNLIEEMRGRGFDEKLRAGQAMDKFILSRSRRHGLEIGQKFIRFRFDWENDIMQVTSINNEVLLSNIEYSSHLEELLNELVKEEID